MRHLDLSDPIIYLISSGKTTAATTNTSEAFAEMVATARAAVAAHCPLLQLREKNLTARSLYELTLRIVQATRGTGTRVLVNDRADVAVAAGADGVHLTTRSLSAAVIRRTFGPDLIIGVSTHSLAEAVQAREDDADFVVFGPVFKTRSKRAYGPPTGLKRLREVSMALAPLPVVALGGIAVDNAADCVRVGARGVAGIQVFAAAPDLKREIELLRLAMESAR
jgi:thiamine-phosphate pyrophosphorylase